MSRGLGKLQRAILDELKSRPGGDIVFRRMPEGFEIPRIREMTLAQSIHDLKVVAEKFNRPAVMAARKFMGLEYIPTAASDAGRQAAFSRAVAGLVERGHLEVLTVVPLGEVPPDHKRYSIVHFLSDGPYLVIHSRQRRFVRVRG